MFRILGTTAAGSGPYSQVTLDGTCVCILRACKGQLLRMFSLLLTSILVGMDRVPNWNSFFDWSKRDSLPKGKRSIIIHFLYFLTHHQSRLYFKRALVVTGKFPVSTCWSFNHQSSCIMAHRHVVPHCRIRKQNLEFQHVFHGSQARKSIDNLISSVGANAKFMAILPWLHCRRSSQCVSRK